MAVASVDHTVLLWGSDGAARRASGVPGARAFYAARLARPDVQLLVRQNAQAQLLDDPKNSEDGTTCITGVWTVAASNFGLSFYFWRIAQDHGQAPWPVQGRGLPGSHVADRSG